MARSRSIASVSYTKTFRKPSGIAAKICGQLFGHVQKGPICRDHQSIRHFVTSFEGISTDSTQTPIQRVGVIKIVRCRDPGCLQFYLIRN